MYVIATFEQNVFVELGITALEKSGIPRERILAAPLDKRREPVRLFDTLHRADGFSLFDVAAILGTVFMLLGAIYGYVLPWGPIIWGIFGALFGIGAGLAIKWRLVKRQANSRMARPAGSSSSIAGVVLLIRCAPSERQSVERILWENTALGVSWVNPHPARGLGE